jgi:hypothetical protein
MKTTIDIPDPLYRKVNMKAFEKGTSLRALMIRGLEREVESRDIRSATPPRLSREERGVYLVNEIGFVVLKRRQPEPVADRLIEALREQEGI